MLGSNREIKALSVFSWPHRFALSTSSVFSFSLEKPRGRSIKEKFQLTLGPLTSCQQLSVPGRTMHKLQYFCVGSP